MSQSWRDQAACVGHDPDMWAPQGRGRVEPEAFRVCTGCPVRAECLDYALTVLDYIEDVGVWGGTSDSARRHVRRGLISEAEAMVWGDGVAARWVTVDEDAELWLDRMFARAVSS